MTAVYPLDMIRGQITTSPGLYPSWYAGLASVYRQGGVRGLFKGASHSAVWAAAYYGAQFFTYDTAKAMLVEDLRRRGQAPVIDTPTSLALGALSGVSAVTLAYPYELVRRKLQVQGLGGRPVLYTSWLDCIYKIVGAGGYKQLYKGMPANLLKTPPSIAITFGAYEFLMNSVFHASKDKQ